VYLAVPLVDVEFAYSVIPRQFGIIAFGSRNAYVVRESPHFRPEMTHSISPVMVLAKSNRLLRTAVKTILPLALYGGLPVKDGKLLLVPAEQVPDRHRRRTIKRYLDELVSAGIAEKQEQPGGTRYYVDVEKLKSVAEELGLIEHEDTEKIIDTVYTKVYRKIATKISGVEERVKKLESLLSSAIAEMESVKSRVKEVEEIRSMLDATKKRLESLEKGLKKVSRKISKLEEQMKEAGGGGLEEIREIKQKIVVLEADVHQLRKRIEELNSRYLSLENLVVQVAHINLGYRRHRSTEQLEAEQSEVGGGGEEYDYNVYA